MIKKIEDEDWFLGLHEYNDKYKIDILKNKINEMVEVVNLAVRIILKDSIKDNIDIELNKDIEPPKYDIIEYFV